MPEPLFLECYQKIAANKLPSRSELIKRISVPIDNEYSEKELWKIHEEYIEVDKEEKKRIFKHKEWEFKDAPQTSLLDLKILLASKIIEKCHFCQHRCGVNRKCGEKEFCKLTDVSRYAAEFLHMEEEPELVPSHTIFFT